jgi:hypothetical protein
MMFRIYILGIFLGFALCQSAYAASQKFVALNLGLTFAQSSVESSGGDTTSTQTVANFHAGFFPFGGFIVGLRHYQASATASVTTSTSTTTSTTVSGSATTSGTGLHLGYYAENGFLFGASYLFNPTYKTSGVTYSGGSAMVADAGWCWEMGDFGFGAQLTYSAFVFTKAKVNGIESDFTKDEKWVDVFPMGFAALFF